MVLGLLMTKYLLMWTRALEFKITILTLTKQTRIEELPIFMFVYISALIDYFNLPPYYSLL